MTRTIRNVALAAAAALVVAAGAHPQAQTASIKADFLKDWEGQKASLVKMAEALPADKYTFKATPAERDFAAQVMHIATVNVMLLKTLGGKAPAPALNEKAMAKDEVIKALSESFDYGTAILNEQTDQSMVATVQGPPWMGPSTRARLVSFLMGHTQDIYGQLAVYLRLNGVVPPASRRP
jgi:uncharacterized damage-inducible protein DinB